MASKLLYPFLPLLARPSPLSSFLPPLTRPPPPRLPRSPHNHQLPLPLCRPNRVYSTAPPKPSKPYTFEDIKSLVEHKDPIRLLIDVREPDELRATGRIPGSVNVPLTSNPDAFFLGEAEFFERFGFRKPCASSSSTLPSSSRSSSSSSSKSGGDASPTEEDDAAAGKGGKGGGRQGAHEGVKEVVFYCKAGVRSRAAARLARSEGAWEGVRVGEYAGSWVEWEGRGGGVER